MSRLVAQLRVGSLVSFRGVTYTVTAKASIPKRGLPDEVYSPTGPERYLVTCDPSSGYSSSWGDSAAHSNNNVLITLTPITSTQPTA